MVATLLRDLPHLGTLLYRLTRDRRVSRLDKLMLAAAAAYVASPLDLIPDWLPILGQLDDLYLIVLVLHRLFTRAGPDLLIEHWTGDPATLEMLLSTLDRLTDWLPPGMQPVQAAK